VQQGLQSQCETTQVRDWGTGAAPRAYEIFQKQDGARQIRERAGVRPATAG
jgi:hypothetical protein